MLGILPKVTKDYILSKITQEQIFERYLGVPVKTDSLINSPIRSNDNNPSFGFNYNNKGKLRARDFAGYFWGDCFDLVAFKFHLNSNDKQDFGKIMDVICREFRIHKYAEGSYQPEYVAGRPNIILSKEKKEVNITIYKRPLNKIDAEYWYKHSIDRNTLDYFKVYACQTVWINNQIVYKHDDSDPAYAYYFGKDGNGKNLVKVYFPFRKAKMKGKSKFITNTDIVQGINQIHKAEIGIVTKSYKDVMAVHKLCKGKYDICAVAPSSENTIIKPDDMKLIKSYFTHTFSFMDFDFTGVKMAWQLRKLYGITPLFLTNGKRGSKVNYGSKDFSDFIADNGIEKTYELIDKFINYFKTDYSYHQQIINNNSKIL